MLTAAIVKEILDASVRDISKRVGKLEVLDSYEGSAVDFELPYTVYVTTSGDFQELFAFCADKIVLETIARNMMRGADISEEQLHICVTEFFNILCGQAISSINRSYRTKTRFSIPRVREGTCPDRDVQKVWNRRNYHYPCGIASFEILKIEG